MEGLLVIGRLRHPRGDGVGSHLDYYTIKPIGSNASFLIY